MKYLGLTTLFAALILYSSPTPAAEKVVVVPIGSSSQGTAEGTDGQLQYNDRGKTGGAELYYDKVSGKLETPGELRTVDRAGKSRLWGQGRPGAATMTHDNPNGYCTTASGINFALSTHFATWGNVTSVCPVGTWVCSNEEVGDTICDIPQLSTYNVRYCNGDYPPGSPSLTDYLFGWLADSDGTGPYSTRFKYSDQVMDIWMDYCNSIRVWCCWQ